jgi:putative Mg2+ transporter-C (MgtC) family protein
MEFVDLFSPAFLEMAGRLLLAMVFGMVIGIDREAQDKPAGMRSHMLVALASASLTEMTFAIVEASDKFGDTVHTDPLRVIEAVVAGIAFLGAGAIIQGRGQVTGITTGASMWLAGAIGIASGLGYYALATLTTLFAIIVLYILGKLEGHVKKAKPSSEPARSE